MWKKPPDGPRHCNCPTWAFLRWWRKGGYVAFRMSRYVPWKPHFLWSSNRQFWWGYVPLQHRTGLKAVFHSLWFRGRVKLER